jgi:hypothetical protein
MRRMSWIRSSKGIALVVLFTVSLAAVGGAVALSVSADGVPGETQVGQPSNATITLNDPFVETKQWTLEGATELRNVSWQVTVLDQGDTVSDETYGSQEFTQALNASSGGDTIEIRIEGDTPPISDYSFDPEETYTLFDLDQTVGSNTNDLNASEVHHYTNDSKSARESIVAAQEAINGTNSEEARNLVNNSISAYDSGNFDNAEDLASQAQNTAEQAEESSEQTQMLLYAGVGVVVIALIGGGIYYWRSQQDDYGKLQ